MIHGMQPTFSKPAESSESNRGLLRSVVSLLVRIHLFCVAIVLASNSPGNYRRSPLQGRLVSIFAPYTRLLHFDPEFTPYYYTLGRPLDDDTWLVIDLYASGEQPVSQQQLAKTIQLPEGGSLHTGVAVFQQKENWVTLSLGLEMLSANGWLKGGSGRADLCLVFGVRGQ